MTENEKKLLEMILANSQNGPQPKTAIGAVTQAIQLERATPVAREEYLRARIRYLRGNKAFWATHQRLGLPDAVAEPLDLEAAKIVEADTSTPAPEAMTPEKLKAYTGRDFDIE